MPVDIKTGQDIRQCMLAGAKKGADAVIATLGPWGRNVSIGRPPVTNKNGRLVYRPPMVTKDGVTVARAITSLPDPFEDQGWQLLKEAAEKTNTLAGDGTTTATLLGYEMMSAGIQLLNEGANTIHVKKGMQKACEAVCAKLVLMARPVQTLDELKAIATISAAGDEEIGSMVAMIVDEIGKSGAVTIAPGVSTGLEYKITNGMQVAVGYSSPYFCGPKGVAMVTDPHILVTTEKITSITTLTPILEQILKANDGTIDLVIFSDGVEGDALNFLVQNHLEKPDKFRCLVLKPPFYGPKRQEILEDIAVAVGARLIDRKTGRDLPSASLADLGCAGRVDATAGVTTISAPETKKDKLEKRIELVQVALEAAETDADKDYQKMRLAGLEGKIATIYVGGSSQMEQQEKQHRVEDACSAARAAKESGILPGGGTAYLRCLDVIHAKDFEREGEKKGGLIVMQSLTKQIDWVVKNAGEDSGNVVQRVLKMQQSEGFNAESGQYGDMFEMKVIDPAKVPITALRNAVSVAGMFLTLEVGVVDKTEGP